MLTTRLHGTRQTRKGASRMPRRLSGPTRVALAIVLTLMAIPAGPLSPTARAATPRYASVGGADSGDCSATPCRTIGYALSQAVDGDTIGVADGLYRENLTVSKSVTLQGAGAGATIIDGSAIATVIAVNSGATVTIEGVTIQGGSGSGPYGSISSTAGG